MSTPSWWQFALLGLAVFRVWKLLAEDSVLDRPRAWLLHAGSWRPDSNRPAPEAYRDKLATFLACPWCAGFWLTLLVWGAWLLWPTVTVGLAVPWAISALVGLLGQHLS